MKMVQFGYLTNNKLAREKIYVDGLNFLFKLTELAIFRWPFNLVFYHTLIVDEYYKHKLKSSL